MLLYVLKIQLLAFRYSVDFYIFITFYIVALLLLLFSFLV